MVFINTKGGKNMIKRANLVYICSLLCFGAFAETYATTPEIPSEQQNAHVQIDTEIMLDWSDEQSACIDAYGCQNPDDASTTNTEEQKQAYSECMRRAMNACLVDIPQTADIKDIKKPDHSDNKKHSTPLASTSEIMTHFSQE